MNRNKLSLLIAGVAALVVLAGGWFLGVQPQLASASTNDAQRTTIETTNATNRAELTRLQQQFTKLGDMKSELADLQASIPSAADTATFIKAMNATADSTGAAITNIAVGDALPYTSPNAPASTDTTATASPSASASPSETPTATPSPTPSGPTTVTNPAVTGTNFTVIPVTVVVKGSYDQALAFTKGLQDGKRLFLINTLTSSTGADATAEEPTTSDSTWTLGGWIYVLDTTASAAASTTTANG